MSSFVRSPVVAGHELPAVACFAVRAQAEPGALPRVLEPFVKRGMQIADVHARILGQADDCCLLIDLQVAGLDDAQAQAIAESLRQMVPVERVLLSRKRLAHAA